MSKTVESCHASPTVENAHRSSLLALCVFNGRAVRLPVPAPFLPAPLLCHAEHLFYYAFYFSCSGGLGALPHYQCACGTFGVVFRRQRRRNCSPPTETSAGALPATAAELPERRRTNSTPQNCPDFAKFGFSAIDAPLKNYLRNGAKSIAI